MIFEGSYDIRGANGVAECRDCQVLADGEGVTVFCGSQGAGRAVAAQAKYNASQIACKAAEDAFTLVQAKYENGRATITEFNESRNQLMKTRSDLVQATYEYVFQTRILQFYRGGEISL